MISRVQYKKAGVGRLFEHAENSGQIPKHLGVQALVEADSFLMQWKNTNNALILHIILLISTKNNTFKLPNDFSFHIYNCPTINCKCSYSRVTASKNIVI